MKRGRFELYDHQVVGVERIIHALQQGEIDGIPTRSFLLCDEMGLGKTLQAIESAKRLNLGNHPILVVCPASCEHVWLKDNPFDVFAYDPKKFSPNRLTGQSMLVISYDMLRNLFKYYIYEKFAQGALSNDELIRYCQIYNKPVMERIQFLRGDDLRRELLAITRSIQHDPIKMKRNHPHAVPIMRQTWGMLIMDEVHRIRSASSGLAKAVGFVDATYRLGLSGTPIVNGGHDLLSIWKYGLGLHRLNWPKIKDDPNSEYCKDIIDAVSLGRKKEAIEGLALPKRDKTQEDVVLQWHHDLDQKRTYIEIKTDSLEYLNDFNHLTRRPGESEYDYNRRRLSMQQTFLGKLQRLRQVCLHMELPGIMRGNKMDAIGVVSRWTPASHCSFPTYTRECVRALLCGINARIPLSKIRNRIVQYYVECCQAIIPSPKMQFVYRMLREHSDTKVAVFCTFRVFLERIMRPWLKQIGVRSATFAGGSKKHQQEALEAFEKDPTVRVLLVVKGAGSEGLNLLSAGVCVIMDPHFNLAMDEQAAQRIDRIGHTAREVRIRRLYMEGSIDEAMKMLQDDKVGEMKGWHAGGGNRSLKAQSLFLQKRDTVQ